MIDKNNYGFIECVSLTSYELINYEPLAGSYAVAVFQGEYLICFSTWRKQWEIPAGGREIDETPEECAIRELFEETGQVVHSMNLKGVLKVRKPDESKVSNYQQETGYWCGPASVRQTLSFHKNKSDSTTSLPSQTTLASKAGTTTYCGDVCTNCTFRKL